MMVLQTNDSSAIAKVDCTAACLEHADNDIGGRRTNACREACCPRGRGQVSPIKSSLTPRAKPSRGMLYFYVQPSSLVAQPATA